MPYWTTTLFPGPFPWLGGGGFPAPPPSQGKGPGNEVDWAIMRNLHGGIPSQRCRILFFSSTSMQNHHSTKLFCCPSCDGIPHSENNTRVTDWKWLVLSSLASECFDVIFLFFFQSGCGRLCSTVLSTCSVLFNLQYPLS